MAIAAGLPSCAGLAGVLAGGYFSDRLTRTHSLRFARCAIGSTGLILSGLLLLGATMTPNKWVAVGLLSMGLGAMDSDASGSLGHLRGHRRRICRHDLRRDECGRTGWIADLVGRVRLLGGVVREL